MKHKGMRDYLSILDEIDDPYNPATDPSLQAGAAEIAKPAPAAEPTSTASTAPAGQAAMSYAGNQGAAAKPAEPAATPAPASSGVEAMKTGIAAGSPAITGAAPAGNMQNAAATMKAAQGGASPTDAAQAGADAAAPKPAAPEPAKPAPAVNALGVATNAVANNPLDPAVKKDVPNPPPAAAAPAAAPKPGDTTTAADGRTYTTQKGVMGQPDTQQRSYKSFGDFFNKITGKGDVNGAVAPTGAAAKPAPAAGTPTAPAGQAAMSYAGNQGGAAAKPAPAPAAGASNAASNAANAALTGGASVPAGAAKPAAKPATVAMEEVTRIKSFAEYLSEAELFEDVPSAGDIFEIEIAREEIVLESFVVGYMEDGIIVEADDTMMRILEHVGYLSENPRNMPPATDTTSPISGRSRRAQDAFKDIDNTDPASQQDLDDFRSRVKSGAGKPTKLQNMNPLDREQWEREKQQHGIQNEAEYQGRNVPLGKPMAGDVKKSKVYVKNAKGNVVKVNFGDPNMTIKKSNPARRKSFRARHNCDNPGPRTSARYWSCRAW